MHNAVDHSRVSLLLLCTPFYAVQCYCSVQRLQLRLHMCPVQPVLFWPKLHGENAQTPYACQWLPVLTWPSLDSSPAWTPHPAVCCHDRQLCHSEQRSLQLPDLRGPLQVGRRGRLPAGKLRRLQLCNHHGCATCCHATPLALLSCLQCPSIPNCLSYSGCSCATCRQYFSGSSCTCTVDPTNCALKNTDQCSCQTCSNGYKSNGAGGCTPVSVVACCCMMRWCFGAGSCVDDNAPWHHAARLPPAAVRCHLKLQDLLHL